MEPKELNQSFVTGDIGGWPYRLLLTVSLSEAGFVVGTIFGGVLLHLKLSDIRHVEPLDGIWAIGFAVHYMQNDRLKVATIRTRKYKDWLRLFLQNRVDTSNQ